MANHASHAALPYPIKNARFTVLVPYVATTGIPTDPVTPDTEVSQDGGAFANCTEEVTTIAGSNGFGYITLTGAETNCSLLAIAAKVASGPNNSLGSVHPRVLAAVGSALALSAGSASGGTLDTPLDYDLTGCFVRTVGGTGGGGTGGANNQARKIASYNTTTGAFTVAPDFETAIDATTTVDVLLPEGVTLGMLLASYLAEVQESLNALNEAGGVVMTSPVATTGLLTLVRGDDYYSADGAALEWTSTEWPDLTAATIRFSLQRRSTGINAIDRFAGSVVTPTGTAKVRVELPAAQTDDLEPGKNLYIYDVEATLAGGNIRTLVHGQCDVIRDSTRPV